MQETRGQRIRRLRQGLNLDQSQLATKAGLSSQSMISRLESDNYKRVPEEILKKIANELNTTLAYINGYDSTLDFMPQHIREFVMNPDNYEDIKRLYLIKEAKKIDPDFSRLFENK